VAAAVEPILAGSAVVVADEEESALDSGSLARYGCDTASVHSDRSGGFQLSATVDLDAERIATGVPVSSAPMAARAMELRPTSMPVR
jgi:hypothetical protein